MSVSVATRPGPAPVDGVAVELYSPLFTGTMIIVLNLFVDLLAVIIDPTITTSPRAGRTRFGASAGSDAIA